MIKELGMVIAAIVTVFTISSCGEMEPVVCPTGQTYTTEYEYHYGYNVLNGKFEFHYGPVSKCR